MTQKFENKVVLLFSRLHVPDKKKKVVHLAGVHAVKLWSCLIWKPAQQ